MRIVAITANCVHLLSCCSQRRGVCVPVAGIGEGISEVAALLEQLTLLSSEIEDDEVMDAQEFINFKCELDLNNPYEPTDEDIID